MSLLHRHDCSDRLSASWGAVLLAVTLLPLMPVWAVAQERSDLRAAVVRVGGCSGVCVDPAGLLLTAKHCDLRDVERVQFGEMEVLAIRIYETELTEGPLVYDCVGSGYPSVPVAHEPPAAGEQVTTLGYPLIASRRDLREAKGAVLRGGEFRFRGEPFPGNLTDMSLRQGWSGGPLFNAQGEVIGLANSSDATGSIFISFAATRQAYDAGGRQHLRRRPLTVILSLDSRDCLRFLSDFSGDAGFQEELREHFQIVVSDASERSDLLQRSGAADLPVFIVPGFPLFSGYQGKQDLLQRLSRLPPESGTPIAGEEAGTLH